VPTRVGVKQKGEFFGPEGEVQRGPADPVKSGRTCALAPPEERICASGPTLDVVNLRVWRNVDERSSDLSGSHVIISCGPSSGPRDATWIPGLSIKSPLRTNPPVDRWLIGPRERYSWPCHVCNKSFGRSEHLRRHLLTQTRSRHFHCRLCRKTIPRK
jgi:hypothetical protein